MKLALCAACGATDDLQYHHLVTRAEGGGDNETNLITLCISPLQGEGD
jgi:5-methylcytosine-specific restriction endonuclease McrA